MPDPQHLIEAYKIAADRIKSEGEWFYKRTTFFYTALALVLTALGYIYSKDKIAEWHYLITLVLSLAGIVISALLTGIIVNSAAWQRTLIEHAASIEDKLEIQFVFRPILDSAAHVFSTTVEHVDNFDKQFFVPKLAMSRDIMVLYYYFALFLLSLMCLSFLVSLGIIIAHCLT